MQNYSTTHVRVCRVPGTLFSKYENPEFAYFMSAFQVGFSIKTCYVITLVSRDVQRSLHLDLFRQQNNLYLNKSGNSNDPVSVVALRVEKSDAGSQCRVNSVNVPPSVIKIVLCKKKTPKHFHLVFI